MTRASLAPWPVIAQPMRGAPIEALQHLLRHRGSISVALSLPAAGRTS